MEENKEKATEQLSGRVTPSQKEYFAGIEGSFAEKVAELIELHKNKIDNEGFIIAPNMDAIQKAINTIIKNIECIELNTNNYINDFNSDISSKINILKHESVELKNIKEENESLKIANNKLLNQYNKLVDENENQKKSLENKESHINSLTKNNNTLLQEKLSYKDTIDKLNTTYIKRIEELESSIVSNKDKISELNNQIELKNEKINSKNIRIEELNQNTKEYKEEIKKLNNKSENLIEQLNNTRIEYQQLEKELNKKIDNLIQQLQQSKEEVHKEQLNNQKLQIELSNLKNNQNK